MNSFIFDHDSQQGIHAESVINQDRFSDTLKNWSTQTLELN